MSSLLALTPPHNPLSLLFQWGRDVDVREGPLDELHPFFLDLPAKCNPGPQKLGPGHDFWTLSCFLEVTLPPSVLAAKEHPQCSRMRDTGVEGNAHRNFGSNWGFWGRFMFREAGETHIQVFPHPVTALAFPVPLSLGG